RRSGRCASSDASCAATFSTTRCRKARSTEGRRAVTIAAGSRLGAYEILSALGAGGMGEVYRARDPRLGREVALKVLPPELAENADRLSRFEQEARSASALNHPNIVTVHDIGRSDSTSYIAMELVDGRTLRELSAGGALTV